MLHVLAIDDSRTVHTFLRSCLERLGVPMEITDAMDGQEAVERVAAGARPDLVFLDWEMPRLDGPSTYQKLRELGVEAPVIMLTSKNDVADIARMLDAGVAEYVLKPFTSDILREKLAPVLGVSDAARDA